MVLVRTTDVNTAPLNSVNATLVGFAHRGNVDSVFVRGDVRKWRLRLVGHDLDALIRAAEQPRGRVLSAAGVHGDVLAPHPPVVLAGTAPRDHQSQEPP